MDNQGGPKFRILAYIDRFDPPDNDSQDAVKLMVADCVKGFWLDVIIEYEDASGSVIIESLGDGKVYQTLEEAEAMILHETGITLQRLPEPTVQTTWSCAAYFIAEFGPTGKPEAKVVAESTMPLSRNKDHIVESRKAP